MKAKDGTVYVCDGRGMQTRVCMAYVPGNGCRMFPSKAPYAYCPHLVVHKPPKKELRARVAYRHKKHTLGRKVRDV